VSKGRVGRREIRGEANEKQTFYKQPYFQEFLEKTKGMWVKPRM